MFDLFFGKRSEGPHIDKERSLDSAPTGFLHEPPVFERRGNEAVGGENADGVVPVDDANAGEGYGLDCAVDSFFGNFNPIACANQVEGGDLNSGGES